MRDSTGGPLVEATAVYDASRAVRHLPGRRAVPRRRQGDRHAAAPARARRRVPAAAELLRADARQHRLPARGAAAGAQPRRHLRRLRRGRRAERLVRRRRSATSTPTSPSRRATPRWPTAPGPSPARTYELSEFLVDVLGVTDVGAYYPHRVTYHPTCHSLRMLRVGDRPYQLAARGARARARRAARRRVVLRLRRHVRGEERGRLHGDAQRQDGARSSRPARASVLGRRLVVPDAHRRRPFAAARPARARVHLAEILASTQATA